jgi:hypothetical protein
MGIKKDNPSVAAANSNAFYALLENTSESEIHQQKLNRNPEGKCIPQSFRVTKMESLSGTSMGLLHPAMFVSTSSVQCSSCNPHIIKTITLGM